LRAFPRSAARRKGAKERAQKKKGDKMFHLEPLVTVKDKLNNYAQAV